MQTNKHMTDTWMWRTSKWDTLRCPRRCSSQTIIGSSNNRISRHHRSQFGKLIDRRPMPIDNSTNLKSFIGHRKHCKTKLGKSRTMSRQSKRRQNNALLAMPFPWYTKTKCLLGQSHKQSSHVNARPWMTTNRQIQIKQTQKHETRNRKYCCAC